MQAVGMHSVAEKHHPNSWKVFCSIVKYERVTIISVLKFKDKCIECIVFWFVQGCDFTLI